MTITERTISREVIAKMTAYTLELREAEIKLNQNESPADLPRELKDAVLASLIEQPWNRYPDFESTSLRTTIAKAYGLDPEEVLVGNGSNELLAAAVPTFVGPGTPVIFPRPTFSLYEKLIAIAGGTAVPIAVDPRSGLLPLTDMLRAIEANEGAVVIVCSPNNPTGGVLPKGGLARLTATGATVLLDRAYGDFAHDVPPRPADRLVTFSTLSKAWGLAGLRVGWLAATAATCREIRKVKLPYSLNIVSEAVAAAAIGHPEVRERNVALAVAERERVFATMLTIPRVTPFPSRANFIAFDCGARAGAIFEFLWKNGVLVRDISSALPGALRVSMGTPAENDRFLELLNHVAGNQAT